MRWLVRDWSTKRGKDHHLAMSSGACLNSLVRFSHKHQRWLVKEVNNRIASCYLAGVLGSTEIPVTYEQLDEYSSNVASFVAQIGKTLLICNYDHWLNQFNGKSLYFPENIVKHFDWLAFEWVNVYIWLRYITSQLLQIISWRDVSACQQIHE